MNKKIKSLTMVSVFICLILTTELLILLCNVMLSGHTEGPPTRPVGSSGVPDNAGKHVPSGNETGNHITFVELKVVDEWCMSSELGHCVCHAGVHIVTGICKMLSVFHFLFVAIIHFLVPSMKKSGLPSSEVEISCL